LFFGKYRLKIDEKKGKFLTSKNDLCGDELHRNFNYLSKKVVEKL